MATGAEKFSTGYKGKKTRKRGSSRREPVAGPYRSQSSVPSIRRKASPKEHRRVPPRSSKSAPKRSTPSADIFATPPLKAPTKKELRQRAAVQRVLRSTLRPGGTRRRSAPSVPTLSARTSTEKGWSPGDPLATAVERDVIAPLQASGKLPEKPTLGYEIYDKLAKTGKLAGELVFVGPELGALGKAVSVGLRGAKVGSTKVGGAKLLGKALKPVPAAAPEAKSIVAAANAAKAARAASRGAGVRGVVKKTGAKLARTESRAAKATAREVTGRTGAKAQFAGLTPLAKAGKVGGLHVSPAVRGHEQALVEHPRTTLQTTSRALPGMFSAPVAAAADVAATAGRAGSTGLHAAGVPGFKGYSAKEIVQPVAELGKEQIDFARQVAGVLTATDSKEVQREVEQNLGLMLPIVLGLTTKAAASKVSRGRISEGVRTVVERTRRARGREHGNFRGKTPRVLEVSGQRKQEALRTANARTRIKRETVDRTRRIRREAGKAKGSEVLRKDVIPRSKLKGLVRGKGDLTIHSRDLLNFAVRHSLPLDNPTKALAEVKRIGSTLKELPPGVKLPADTISTRDAIRFIERNPKVLSDPHLRGMVTEYKKQARYARDNPELEPEHSERARFLSTAVTRDIPLAEERFPRSIRSEVRAKPTRGRAAKDVLRREARSDRQRAKRMSRKAATREGRARAIRAELKVRERTQPGYAVNSRLQARAERFERQAKTYRDGAKRAMATAKRKHKAATEVDTGLNQEFVSEMQEILRKEGLPEPEYTYTGKAREAPTYGATGAKLTQFPGRSKFRKGTAEEYGLVQEGFGPTLRESIARPVSRRESYKAMKGFLDENEFRAGKKTEWTSDEARQLFEDGVIARDRYVLIPRQLYKRAYAPEEWAGHLKAALDLDPDQAMKVGRHFKLVRRAAAKEFFDQMGTELISPKLAKVNRVTSYLMLATSPAWAVAQMAAEFVQGAVSQPKILNPAFIRKTMKAYDALPPHKRQAFDSWVGVTNRVIDRPEDLALGLKAGDRAAAADAFGVLDRTKLGRVIKSIPTSIRDLDQWKGGRYRVLVASAKMDAEVNGFLRGTRGLHGQIAADLKRLRGKSFKDQMAYVADHPELSARYQGYLDDVMGNWSALTNNERTAAQFLVFYPFLRFGLRWISYSFPKRHPIKMAAMTYLGQANANAVKELLGGNSPSFFTGWGQAPIHFTGDNRKLAPLERISLTPALVEALGDDEKTLGTSLLRILQPSIAAGITATTGINPLSGKQESGAGIQAINAVARLSPITRVIDEKTIGAGRKRTEEALPVVGSTDRQNSLDKLFAKLNEYGTVDRTVRTLGAPFLPKNLGYQKDILRLDNILKTMEENGREAQHKLAIEAGEKSEGRPWKKRREAERAGKKAKAKMEKLYGEASNELDALFRRYKIPFKKAESNFMEAYSGVEYGSQPDIPYGTPKIGGKGGVKAPKITNDQEAGPTIYFGDKPPKRRQRRKPRREPAGPTIVGPIP